MEDRIAFTSKRHTSVGRREKAAGPKRRTDQARVLRVRLEYHESWQIPRLAAESVVDLGPQAGMVEHLRSVIQQQLRWMVIGGVRVHGADHAQLVRGLA